MSKLTDMLAGTAPAAKGREPEREDQSAPEEQSSEGYASVHHINHSKEGKHSTHKIRHDGSAESSVHAAGEASSAGAGDCPHCGTKE